MVYRCKDCEEFFDEEDCFCDDPKGNGWWFQYYCPKCEGYLGSANKIEDLVDQASDYLSYKD